MKIFPLCIIESETGEKVLSQCYRHLCILHSFEECNISFIASHVSDHGTVMQSILSVILSAHSSDVLILIPIPGLLLTLDSNFDSNSSKKSLIFLILIPEFNMTRMGHGIGGYLPIGKTALAS